MRINAGEALAVLLLLGVGAVIAYGHRDRTGERMLVWEPVSRPPYPTDTVTVLVRSPNPLVHGEWERMAEAWPLDAEPYLRIATDATGEPYAGPDSSVMSIGSRGDTLYWRPVWAMMLPPLPPSP